jgi:hypothetical protein
VTRSPYEIRVVGVLGPAAREAFADLAVDVEPTATVLSGELDQPGLHAVLEQVCALGLELVDVKPGPGQLPDDPGACPDSSGPDDPRSPAAPVAPHRSR